MNILHDENIQKMFQQCKYSIPDSYNEKFEATVSEIKNRTITCSRKWFLTTKMARVAILLVALVICSGTTYAAVSLYQQRMASIPENVVQKYNNNVQNLKVDVDGYSRPLTESEEELMISLRNQYEEKGRFPQNEIKQVDNASEVAHNELCFVSGESTFYLPERTLSEEEILEIIDLQEKRDYSVRQQNEEQTDEPNQSLDTTKDYMVYELKKQSVEDVAALFGIDTNALRYVTLKQTDNSTEYVIKGEDTIYSVYYLDDNIKYRVVSTKENMSSYYTGVKLEKLNINSVMKKINKQAEMFTNKHIESQEAYSMINDNGELAFCTVSIYYRMTDGSGCVAVYNSAYKDLYDIYIVKDANKLNDMIKQKKDNAKKNGNTYKLIK